MAEQPENPLSPKPLPAVQRLSRAVLVVAAGLVTITLLAVAWLATPRPLPRATPFTRPPVPADPGFLQRPPASLPPARPELTEQEYLRRLLERGAQPGAGQLGRTGGPGGTGARWGAAGLPGGPGGPGVEGAYGADGADDPYASREEGGALAGAGRPGSGAPLNLNPPPPPSRDPRREAFLRALRAPLAQAVPAAPRRTAASGRPWPAMPSAEALALDGIDGVEGIEGIDGVDDAGGGAEQTASDEPPRQASPGGPPPSARGAELPAGAPFGAGARSRLGTAASAESAGATAGGPGAATNGRRARRAAIGLAGNAGADPPGLGARGGAAFTAPGAGDTLASRALRKKTILPAGTVIPALLLTEVNSDLPGPLMAQVSRDVYDLAQRSVALARGTRLLGRYDHQVAVGQRRLLVAWTRMQLLDGTLIELPGLPGADAGGAAGLPARVQNHLLRVFGDAVLLSLLSVGADLSQPPSRSLVLTPSAGSIAAAAVGQQLSEAGTQLLRRDLSIQPTLRLPAGTPLTVFVNADLAVAAPAGPAAAPVGALDGDRP